ncbi:MAG TPA: AraC family transcriptional regulator [Candidatus Gallacutalibacter stercoravium]|nr:AraC family transcriptional regulator [Candidatus Gallacutalibacter stercoravium]
MDNITYINGLFCDTYRVEPHLHKTYELVYYTQGNGHVRFDGVEESFSPGTVTLIAPGVRHTDFSATGFRNLHLNLLRPGIPVDRYLIAQDSDRRDIYSILLQMHNEYHLKRSNWRELVNCLYDVLLQYLLAFGKASPKSPYVEQLMHDMIDNLSNPFYQVGQAIAAFPFNPNYFRQIFQKEMGCTPSQYLIGKRMEYAKELIRAKGLSGYSFQQIALLCGYNDSYFFSRTFKKHTGLSPRSWYRQQVGGR